MKQKILFFLLLAILLGQNWAVYNVTSCQTLPNSNEYYVQQNNLSAPTCIYITYLENVTYDCNGYSIFGGGGGLGHKNFWIEGSHNITIKNCILGNVSYDFYIYNNNSNITMENITHYIDDNSNVFTISGYGENITFRDSNVSNNYGINFGTNSNYVYVYNNTFYNITNIVIPTNTAGPKWFYNNTVAAKQSVATYGFYVYNFANNVNVENNTFWYSYYGSFFYGVRNSVFRWNKWIFNRNRGIYIRGLFENITFTDNYFSNNTYYNILMTPYTSGSTTYHALNLTFANNLMENVSNDCYYISTMNHSRIENNTFRNCLWGMRLYYSHNNTIRNNDFSGTTNTIYDYEDANYINGTYDCSEQNIIGGLCLGGNYWGSHYSGTDKDGDGIGETPYQLPSGTYDYLPLTNTLDPSTKNITSCTSINISGYYVYQNNISGILSSSLQYCVYINSSNVYLNCRNYFTTYNTSSSISTGIGFNKDVTNITIRNCRVNGYAYGIGLFGTNQKQATAYLYLNALTNNSKYEVYFDLLKYVLFENNTISIDSEPIYCDSVECMIRKNIFELNTTSFTRSYLMRIGGLGNISFINNTIEYNVDPSLIGNKEFIRINTSSGSNVRILGHNLTLGGDGFTKPGSYIFNDVSDYLNTYQINISYNEISALTCFNRITNFYIANNNISCGYSFQDMRSLKRSYLHNNYIYSALSASIGNNYDDLFNISLDSNTIDDGSISFGGGDITFKNNIVKGGASLEFNGNPLYVNVINNTFEDGSISFDFLSYSAKVLVYNNLFYQPTSSTYSLRISSTIKASNPLIEIYHNEFNTNTKAIDDANTSMIYWYSRKAKKGNWWWDYTGVDADGDGVGETPYNITNTSGGLSNQDLYPLTYFPNDDPINITIIQPNNTAIEGYNQIAYNISDDFFWSVPCYVSVDNNSVKQIAWENITNTYIMFFPAGKVNLTISCYDYYNNSTVSRLIDVKRALGASIGVISVRGQSRLVEFLFFIIPAIVIFLFTMWLILKEKIRVKI